MNEPTQIWDEEFDVVVVGSGAGGMTAALCAAGEGLKALVIEKSEFYGGTSAVSGGGIWIPCNDDIEKNGGRDSYEAALGYVKLLTEGEVPESRIAAYLQNAPEMVRHLARQFGVRFRSVPLYPDYYPDKPGGLDGHRSMEPVEFNAALLGEEFDRQRPPFKGTQVMGRLSMNQVEAHTLFTKGKGWIGLIMKMMLRYWLDLGWRFKTKRDRRMTLGQALVGQLRYALQQQQVPLWLETGLTDLVHDNGRVTGVVAQRGGRAIRLRARRGVILASGGFESNQQMREQYLPHPTQVAWTGAPPINHGDGIRAGQALGAGLGFMNLVWGSPTVHVPGASSQTTLFVERAMPRCVIVNRKGQRFVNEAAAYPDVVTAMYADDAKGNGAVPAWFIFDAQFRKKYPAGLFLPGQMQPDSALPKDWLDKVYYRADSLAALAAKIGVDAQGLAATIERFNAHAVKGEDPDFHKGTTAIDRYYSDPQNQPNPCLGPLTDGPFYAIRLDPGEIGTKGGLLTDEHARVLREDGGVIEGLYATGNTSAAVMGKTYAGAGSTLGPAMTFGYLAARDLARQPVAPTVTA
ncbi:FAD-dependent oxidoreductase [Flagellatimonas centrodinii]|uniref:FAD-dependent oxidoreductase n=1 Tax=Flagellatimonas centrodinii TaxID=2806210 RepID=UPI001FF821BB|nr:FAD-dependent oxidoreductase [Flagellatimonas centrodinii]ULQ47790.1 FAD-dependent oxidoreductase [Flagellatimonas centrodinii]